jgi:hypothetical protein
MPVVVGSDSVRQFMNPARIGGVHGLIPDEFREQLRFGCPIF